MENASKALLMAAGVLIGLLLLTLAVYLFTTFGANAREIRNEINSAQLTEFNAKFNVYADRKDITIYNIISLANLAKENNEYHKDDSNYNTDYKIEITLFLISDGEVVTMNKFTLEKEQELIKKYSTVSDGKIIDTFNCKKISYHPNGRIALMSFYKN